MTRAERGGNTGARGSGSRTRADGDVPRLLIGTGGVGMREGLPRRARWLVLCAAFGLLVANAASDVEVVAVDLAPLIERAAPRRAQFAVDVPHAADLESKGRWVRADGVSTWTYTVRVPGAVSLTFHARSVSLPMGATLRVHARGETYEYDRLDVPRRELWSRLAPGDTLGFELQVPTAFETGARFEIASLQAGYRALVPGGRNHPRYDALAGAGRARALDATSDAPPPVANANGGSCVENYSCRASAANANAAASSVVVIIRNQYQCTGTLLADVPGTRTPYVVTARHCQEDDAGRDDAGAAAATTFYWNAVSPCGQTLASLFAAAKAAQSGARTRVLQQDSWLLQLDVAPTWNDAYWSGWDATGGTFVGGYSVHYAVGGAQQYAQWFGQAVSATYQDARFAAGVWRVQNEVGNVGFGASGGALFDPASRFVGVLSRGSFYPADSSGYGVCPTVPPTVPTASDWAAEFNALSSVWNSTADASSPTGPATFRSVLDPQGTGALVADGRESAPRIELTQFSTGQPEVGQSAALAWTTQRADTCTATGGGPGSTWPGTGLPANGNRVFTETTSGTFEYTLTCTKGGLSSSSRRTLQWSFPPVSLTLTTSPTPFAFFTEPTELRWSSNQSSCEAFDGAIAPGWAGTKPGSGTFPLSITTAGLYLFGMRCGVAPNVVERTVALSVGPPTASVEALRTPTRLRVGTEAILRWDGGARTCERYGGVAGDGWAGPTELSGTRTLTATTPGTATYGLRCTAGTTTVQDEVAIDWTSDPPSAQLTAVSPQIVYLPPTTALPPNLSWTATVRPCALAYAGPTSGTVPFVSEPIGETTDLRERAGRYTYTLTCGTGADIATATATIDWVLPTPNVTLAVQNVPTYTDDGVELLWSSNVLPCTASGGAGGDGWAGARAAGGLLTARPPAGSYTYRMTCGEGAQVGEASVNVNVVAPPAPLVDLQLSPTAVRVFEPATLTWRAEATRACVARSGTNGPTWGGSVATSGSFVVQEPVAGTYTYSLSCSNSTGTTERTVTLNVTDAPGATATLTASPSTVIPGQPVQLTWTSTIAPVCTASGGAPTDGWAGSRPPSGSTTVLLNSIGTYVYALQCGSSPLARQTVSVVEPRAPVVTLDAAPAALQTGQTTTLTWSTTDATSCSGVGGFAGDGWAGPRALQGSLVVTPTTAGTYTYALDCTNPPFSRRAERAIVVTSAPPTASLTSSASSATAGDAFTLTWSSTNSTACTASGGATGDGWSGSAIATSGSRSVTVANAGQYTYTVDCSGAGGTARAQVGLTVNARPSGGGGGGGGGGAFGWLALACLAAVPALRVVRAR